MPAIDPNIATQYYQQWSYGIQHEVPGAVVVDLTYQGKRGSKLTRTRDINQRSTEQPEFGHFHSSAERRTKRTQRVRFIMRLNTRVEKRNSNGQSFLLSYTFGKMIDDATGSPQDSYNLRAERALSSDDVRHRFNISYIVPLPFGQGRKFGGNTAGLPAKPLAAGNCPATFAQTAAARTHRRGRSTSAAPVTPGIAQILLEIQ